MSNGCWRQMQSIKRFVAKNNLGSINGLMESQKNKWIPPPVNIVIFSEHRILALIGQKGVVATNTIPNNTCLTQYSGVEYTNGEWDTVYWGSNKFLKHRPYLCTYECNNHKITIDAMELNDQQFALYINDYRQNIYQTFCDEKTDSDVQYCNAMFCEVKINKCHAIFIVTTRKIQKDEEICLYYGPNYGDVLNNMNTVRELQKYNKDTYKHIFATDCGF